MSSPLGIAQMITFALALAFLFGALATFSAIGA